MSRVEPCEVNLTELQQLRSLENFVLKWGVLNSIANYVVDDIVLISLKSQLKSTEGKSSCSHEIVLKHNPFPGRAKKVFRSTTFEIFSRH